MQKKFHLSFLFRATLSERTDSPLRTKHDGTRGLILLTPELGDYRAIKHPTFKIIAGEHIDFYCPPLCHKNLMVERNDKKIYTGNYDRDRGGRI